MQTQNVNGRSHVIEMKYLDGRQGIAYRPADPEVIFVCQGEMVFEYENGETQVIPEKMFLMLGCGSDIQYRSHEDTLLVICRPNQLAETFGFISDKVIPADPFAFNDVISNFIDGLVTALRDGLQDHTYIEAKAKELISLLQFYYKDKFAAVLEPRFYTDLWFIEKVSQHMYTCRTVKELAEACCMSESGFYKKFEGVFRQAPSEFLLEIKKKNIHRELISGSQSITELSDRFEFSTTSNFGRFCKKYFGMTPLEVRKNQPEYLVQAGRNTDLDCINTDREYI